MSYSTLERHTAQNWKNRSRKTKQINRENSAFLDRLLKIKSHLETEKLVKFGRDQDLLLSQISNYDSQGRKREPILSSMRRGGSTTSLMASAHDYTRSKITQNASTSVLSTNRLPYVAHQTSTLSQSNSTHQCHSSTQKQQELKERQDRWYE